MLNRMKWICGGVLALVILAIFAPVMAGNSVAPPKTGQTTCYDTAGTAMSCLRTRQDGEIQAGADWPNPRFVDNADQTVTDNLTGLIWSKDANPIASSMTWQEAQNYIKTLNNSNYQGYNDWRIPNVNEMKSLVNLGQLSQITWLKSQGFSNFLGGLLPFDLNASYWSSTTDANITSNAWIVDIGGGGTGTNSKTAPWSNLWPVRNVQLARLSLPKTGQTLCYDESGATIACSGTGQDGELQIGAPWPSPRFATNADQTVTDNLTGLVWAKNANLIKTRDPSFDIDYNSFNSQETPGDGRVTWQHALDYLNELNIQNYMGHSDWRLPNRTELESLANNRGQANTDTWLDTQGFLDIQASSYWSSTTFVSSGTYTESAWVVSMNMVDGYMGNGNKMSHFYVWPVCGGQISSSSITVPAPPVITSVIIGNGQATVYFNTPVSNGGSSITSYTVTAIPGNITATGTGNFITITGLTNGVSYTFTVMATNALGNGTASSASNSYTPSNGTAVPVMDGIWLLPGMLAGLGMIARRRKG